MKDKFIRILSPITLCVVAILDIAVIAYAFFAVKQLMRNQSATTIIFALIEIFAIVIAVLVTREVFKNGVIFHDDEAEFLGLDSDNIFDYENITKVETFKDTAPSFVKNFVDRQAKIIITLKDEQVITIDIGLCTKHTLELIKRELLSRTGLEDIENNNEKIENNNIDTDDNKENTQNNNKENENE